VILKQYFSGLNKISGKIKINDRKLDNVDKDKDVHHVTVTAGVDVGGTDSSRRL
jgi:hypothetical protein